MQFITHKAGKLQQWLIEVAGKSRIFIPTSIGRGYLIGGVAAFSDRWEQDVLLAYRSR